MGRPTQTKSITTENTVIVSVSYFPSPRLWSSHATLRPGNDTQVRTCYATRFDLHIPRTLNGDACEQDEEECGGADDGEDCDEDVGVLVEISVRARYET